MQVSGSSPLTSTNDADKISLRVYVMLLSYMLLSYVILSCMVFTFLFLFAKLIQSTPVA